MGNTGGKAGVKISRDQMGKSHQDASAQEERVQTALRQRDWTHPSLAKWGRGWAGAWTTTTARPLDFPFVSASIAETLLERSPGERNLLRCEGQGFRRSQEDSTRVEPHMPPAQASCEQALVTSTEVGTAQQAYSPLWPTNGAVCTPHMQVLTL